MTRLRFLNGPMRYDESWTYVKYAHQSVRHIVETYDWPNNHIFHSILVHAMTAPLGDSPWAIRLPAFVAGVALVPAMYLAGQALYGRVAGLVASAMTAVATPFVAYSVNARGYTILCLAFVLMIWVAARLAERAADTILWVAWGLLAVVGAWTAPIMIFPIGICSFWLGLLFAVDPRRRWAGLTRLAATLIGVGLLAALLYAPTFGQAGWDYAGAPTSFWRLTRQTVDDWATNVPSVLQVVVIALAVVGIAAHRSIGKQRIPLIAGATVIPLGVAVVGRTPPFPRTWMYLLILVILAAAGGAVWVSQQLPAWSGPIALGAGVAIGVLGLAVTLRYPDVWHDRPLARDGPAVAELAKRELPGGGSLVTTPFAVIVYQYYLGRARAPVNAIDPGSSDPSQTPHYLVVAAGTPDDKPETLFSQLRLGKLGLKPVEIQRFPRTSVYRLQAG